MKKKNFRVAAKALIFYKESFLIIHRSNPTKSGQYYWELAGGKMKFGESPEEALRREIQEETGLTVQVLYPLSTWHSKKNKHTQLIGITFVCKAERNEIQLSKEHTDFAWISSADLHNYSLHPSLVEQLNYWNWKKIIESIKI